MSFKLKLTQLHYIFLLYRYKNDKTWADYLYMNVGGKYMKKLSIIIGIIILFTMSNLPMIHAEENKLEKEVAKEAKAALLLERDSGKVLYEKNPHEKLPPASMTKIMTLLLVMEALEEEKITLKDNVTISEYAASMGGSQVFLAAGEQMTVKDLLKAVAIASANDASVALAEEVAGSEAAFVKMMNEKLTELNLENSHFENTSGLPSEKHYSTAYDMGIIAKELLKYEEIIEYTKTYEDYLRKGEENEFWLVNTNKLVRSSPYVDGLKTGYTSEAKYCLTATANKDDMRVVSVVMGAEDVKTRNKVTMNLIDMAYSQYTSEKLYKKDEVVGKLALLHTEENEYKVVTSEPISLLQEKGKKQNTEWDGDVRLGEVNKLPVKKGESVGKIQIKQDKEIVHESDVYVEKPIEKASFKTLWTRSLGYITKFHEK